MGKFVEKMLDRNHYSATTISNITEKIWEDIETDKNACLKKIILDGLYFSVRRDTVEKEVIYIVLGVTLEGRREILGFYVGGKEAASG